MTRRPPKGFPDVIDFNPKQSKRLAWLITAGVVILLVLLSAGSLAQFYLDQLWFEHLGFGARFWKEINFRATVSLAAGLIAAIPLWLTIHLLYRAIDKAEPEIEVLEPGENPTDFARRLLTAQAGVVRLILNIGRWVVAVIAGLVAAFSADADWQAIMLWWYRQPMGKTDAVYGRDISYYLFAYPFEQIVVGDGLTVAFFAALILFLVSLWAGLPQMLGKPSGKHVAGGMEKLHNRLIRLWGVWVAVALVLLGWRHLLSRVGLLYTDHPSSFVGIDYVGDHWWRYSEYGLAFLAFIVALVALVVAAAPRSGGLRKAGISALIIYVVGVVLSFVIGGLYWAVRVRPNELESDRPYIGLSITGTRQAFGLDKFHEQEYNPSQENQTALTEQRTALGDVRLWDWQALYQSLEQEQALRPYYQFRDIDVDRYKIGDQVHSVMVSARELSTDQLPANSHNWTNERFIYTHGYGITMNKVNTFSTEGGPQLLLKDMPVVSTAPNIKITQPQIYFGELTRDHVYVQSTQKEFDYPVGQDTTAEANATTVYQGKEGIPVYSYGARIAAAIALGDGFQLLLSNYLTPQTKLLYRRQIRDRIQTIAPFLVLDGDPYVMITDSGRIQFVYDAYTASDGYPESSAVLWGNQDINYIRNSVKAVIDAYDGNVTLYVMDEEDPIIKAYRRFWPDIFKSGSEMTPDLKAHLRYPEGLMQTQARIYATYHMTDPQTFYNKEDLWQIAHQIRFDQKNGNQNSEMSPYFIRAALTPDGTTSFTLILPFTPSSKNNLIAWMAAGCDPENYGQVYVYRFPKNRLTTGPLQFDARIDQDSQLSQTLTLWNQQGSKVVRGDTLALPVADQMVYIEPIYLQAQQSPMPELRLVVLGLENDLYYAPTFEEAFAKLAGGSNPTNQALASAQQGTVGQQPTQGSQSAATSQSSNATSSAQPQDAAALARSAADHLRNYEKATAEGRHEDAGRELDALKSDLEKLNRLNGKK